MLPSVVRAYLDEGYVMRLGSLRLPTSGVQPAGAPQYIPGGGEWPTTDWGFSVRDVYAFLVIGRELRPRHALIIGNAYGISAVTLGELLKPIAIDAIDAEVRDDGAIGSDLTRRVARRLGLDLNLAVGYSPQHLDRACRAAAYDLVFVDGLHTNEQMLADFVGVKDRLAPRSVVYFHDVGLCTMDEAWAKVKAIAVPLGFTPHDLTFTDFGSTVLVRGVPELDAMFAVTCRGLRDLNERYPRGYGFLEQKLWPETPVRFLPAGRRIALYGAGTDLEPYRTFIESRPDLVAAIIDDDPAKAGTRRFGVPIVPSTSLPALNVGAVVISTRTYEQPVRARLAQLVPGVRVLPEPGTPMPVELHAPITRDTLARAASLIDPKPLERAGVAA